MAIKVLRNTSNTGHDSSITIFETANVTHFTDELTEVQRSPLS